MKKVGRNDPCPCGSGKKYKNCCMQKDTAAADSLWHNLRGINDKLVNKLMEHLHTFYQDDIIIEAWSEFTLNEVEDPDPEISPEQVFFPWLLYSYLPDEEDLLVEGKDLENYEDFTIAESYRAVHEAELSDLEIRFIEAIVNQPYSFYEILECKQGEGFKLKDIFLGEGIEVTERKGSQNAQKGDILYARVIQIDHVGMLVGCSSVLFPPAYKIHIIELISVIRSEADPIMLHDLFEWEEEIRQLYFELYTALITPPQLVNTDGDPLCFHDLYFDIDSPQIAFDMLKSLALTVDEKELLKEAKFDKKGNIKSIEFPWLKQGNKAIKSWENTVLGHIKIDGKQLTVSVNSKKRAEIIKRKVNSLLKEHVKYRTIKVQSITSLMNKAEENSVEKNQREQEFLEKQSEYQEIIDAELSDHWEQWVYEKLPALGGETPIEAVKDPDGREMVIALLDQFERNDEKQPLERKQHKYIEGVQKKLGL